MLTIVAVTLLVAVAFVLFRAQQTLAHTARALVAERDAERTARRRADLVAAVSELLDSMLEPQVMLSRLTDLFVPALGDVAVLDLLAARRLAARRGHRRGRSGHRRRPAPAARGAPAPGRQQPPGRHGAADARAGAAAEPARQGPRLRRQPRARRARPRVRLPVGARAAADRPGGDVRHAVVRPRRRPRAVHRRRGPARPRPRRACRPGPRQRAAVRRRCAAPRRGWRRSSRTSARRSPRSRPTAGCASPTARPPSSPAWRTSTR